MNDLPNFLAYALSDVSELELEPSLDKEIGNHL